MHQIINKLLLDFTPVSALGGKDCGGPQLLIHLLTLTKRPPILELCMNLWDLLALQQRICGEEYEGDLDRKAPLTRNPETKSPYTAAMQSEQMEVG